MHKLGWSFIDGAYESSLQGQPDACDAAQAILGDYLISVAPAIIFQAPDPRGELPQQKRDGCESNNY